MHACRTPALLLCVLVALPAGPASAKRTRSHGKTPVRLIKARANRAPSLKAHFARLGLPYPPPRVFVRVFKKERRLEVWAAPRRGTYKRVKTYPVCAASGKLGPKRRQGDLQVPEGFYRVSLYNAWSSYHLSLGINYPNASDRKLGHKPNLGSAIMIHGSCASIGCVAITDPLIEEVFVMAHAAARRGHRVPVHIFPTRLDAKGMAKLAQSHAHKPKLVAFWKTLQPGYLHFEKTRTIPGIIVDRRGTYRLTSR